MIWMVERHNERVSIACIVPGKTTEGFNIVWRTLDSFVINLKKDEVSFTIKVFVHWIETFVTIRSDTIWATKISFYTLNSSFTKDIIEKWNIGRFFKWLCILTEKLDWTVVSRNGQRFAVYFIFMWYNDHLRIGMFVKVFP